MLSQIQQSVPVSQKFMCLEDRLLKALYKEEGPVSLQSIAYPMSITATAALSIVHRIRSNYPEFIQLEEEGIIEDCYLIPSGAQMNKVQEFINNGGFTKINEEEFLQYYEKELKREKRVALLRLYKAKIKREKWAIGISSLVGLGIIIATYIYKQKEQF